MPDSPVILITGASSGIGAAAARLFGKHGYRVALAARRAERLHELAGEINAAGGQALAVPSDLSRWEQIEALAAAVLDHWGQIDILFNNAGFGRLDWFENLDPQDDIAAQINVDLTGLMQMTRAVLPHMLARRRGHIINMASLAAFVATPTYTVYAAAKYGVRGFSDALRREVSGCGIYVSTIYPGGTETEFAQIAKPGGQVSRTPGWLRLSSEDVAYAVLSLARRPRRTLIQPGIMRLPAWLNTLAPGLFDWALERAFVRRERPERRAAR